MKEELLVAANRAQGIVIARDKQAVIQLANDLQLWDIKVMDYNDLYDGHYYLGVPTFIWDRDEFIHEILKEDFGLDYKGGA